MSGNERIFQDMNTTVTSEVRMENGAIVQAKEKGIIVVETKKKVNYINDVLLVTDLEQNLVSVVQLVQNGYYVHFEDGAYKIYDNKKKLINYKDTDGKK